MPFLLLRITKSIAHENDLCRGEHQQQKPQILCNYSTQQYRKPFSFSPSPMSTSPTTSAQSDLDLSSLVNQLSASTDFNDLRQKMTKIENSKVPSLPNPTHSLDKGLRCPPQTPTRETREKGILSPYSSPT